MGFFSSTGSSPEQPSVRKGGFFSNPEPSPEAVKSVRDVAVNPTIRQATLNARRDEAALAPSIQPNPIIRLATTLQFDPEFQATQVAKRNKEIEKNTLNRDLSWTQGKKPGLFKRAGTSIANALPRLFGKDTLEGRTGGLFSPAVDVASAIAKEVVAPGEEQRALEAQIFPEFTSKSRLGRIIKTPANAVVDTAKVASRLILPGTEPLRKDIDEIFIVNTLSKEVADGRLSPDVLNGLEILKKKNSRIVGDVALGVLSLYTPNIAKQAITQAGKAPTILRASTAGFKQAAIDAGVPFGLAQTLSEGTTDPKEIAQIMATNIMLAGVVGATLSGTIPASRKTIELLQKAKAEYDLIPNKQGGFVLNPLDNNPEGKKEGDLVGKVTIGGKEVDITKGGKMEIPVKKPSTELLVGKEAIEAAAKDGKMIPTGPTVNESAPRSTVAGKGSTEIVLEKPERFTKLEQNTFNNNTHFPLDYNKEHSKIVNSIQADAIEKFGANLPQNIQKLLREYGDKAEEYLRAKGAQMTNAPSPFVTGRAGYNFGKAGKALSLWERKAKEFAAYTDAVKSQINREHKAQKKAVHDRLSEADKIKLEIETSIKQRERFSPERDSFFIEKLDRRIKSLNRKLTKVLEEDAPPSISPDGEAQKYKSAEELFPGLRTPEQDEALIKETFGKEAERVLELSKKASRGNAKAIEELDKLAPTGSKEFDVLFGAPDAKEVQAFKSFQDTVLNGTPEEAFDEVFSELNGLLRGFEIKDPVAIEKLKMAIDRFQKEGIDWQNTFQQKMKGTGVSDSLANERLSQLTDIWNKATQGTPSKPEAPPVASQTPDVIEASRERTADLERANNEFLKVSQREAEAELPSESILSIRRTESKIRELYKAQQYRAEDILSKILTSFELAEPGRRIAIGVYMDEWRAIPSTFPQWIPEESRSKEALNRVLSRVRDINSLRYPDNVNAKNQAKLIDMIFDSIDSETGIDTSFLREEIIGMYKPEVRAALRDERAVARIAERQARHIDTILGDEAEKKARAERVKKSAEEGQKRAEEQAAKEAKLSKAVEEAKREARRERSLWGQMVDAWAPIRKVDKQTHDIYRDWKRKLLIAKELATEELVKYKNKPERSFKDIKEYQAGKQTPWIREAFDALFTEANRRGLDFQYRENYMPQVYAESPKEVEKALVKYLKDKGVEEGTINAYMNGEELPPALALKLKLRPDFIKTRVFPDYITAEKYGLTPKYETPAQLIAHYREQMEKALANRDFLQKLQDEGKILPYEIAPASWSEIKLPFSKRQYSARPQLAEILNGQFRSEGEPLRLTDRVLNLGAVLSRKAQELALSAGVPQSTINFFSIGQLIKALTAGNFKSVPAFLRANFNDASIKFFEKNQDVLKQMAGQGIELGDVIGSYGKLYSNVVKKWGKYASKVGKTPLSPSSYSGFWRLVGESFDKVFNEKTFASFMPQLYTQTFKDIYEKAIQEGVTKEAAEKLAGDVTKNTYGLFEDVGRTESTKDVMSALLFAPRFREGMVRTFFNTGKAGVDFLKTLGGTKSPLDPTLVNNRKLLAGMILTFAAYNLLNKKLNGYYMWDNEAGREFALRIPGPGDTILYIEFMPSSLAFIRNMISSGFAFAKGDIGTGVQKGSSLLSMPIKLTAEALGNEDYFGREIYKDTDTGLEKMKKVAWHLGLGVAHPYIRETKKYLTDDQPLYQSLSYAMEMPFKFSDEEKAAKSRYYQMLKEQEKLRARAREKVQPIFERAQELSAEGKSREAQALVDGLSEDDYKIYKAIKSGQKRKDTMVKKPQLYKLYLEAQRLKKEGRQDEAQALVEGLSATDYKSYQKLKESQE